MPQENKEEYIPITFAQLNKMIINDLNNSGVNIKTALTTRYTKEQILSYLERPERSQKQLRNLSRYLYSNSAHYRRLIWYFAGMLRFDYILEPYDLDLSKVSQDKTKFLKQYQNIAKILDNMNIPHEMIKVLKTAYKEDIFYGYEYMTNDSYFIKKLDPDYCMISSVEDGVYNFAFDFSYFDTNNVSVKTYPDEFKNKYLNYKKDPSGLKWQELDSDNTICIKINEEIEYPLPPFNTVFESVFDIDESKRLNKVKNRIDNYMILTQKIPLDDKKGEINKFLIDLDTAMSFHNKATDSLPEEVGLVTSPMDINAIKLERKNKDTDATEQAQRDYYDAAGVSQFLFNGSEASVSGISNSIITDEQVSFMILKQIERWLNRKLKKINKTYKFRVKFLETTRFNIDDVRKSLLSGAQYGMPTKSALAATYDLTPSAFSNMTFLENEVLELHDKLIPLASSHTQTSDQSQGRPQSNEKDLSPSGEKTRETDGNVRN